MDAVSEADLVVVTDTGSTDQTVEKLRDRGAVVYIDPISPWRFDVARNTAMDHIPEDVDICVSSDLDEVFEKGWREKLEKAWQPCHTRARYLFTWEKSDGEDGLKRFPMEKIHRRHGFRWVRPVHEMLKYVGEGSDHTVFVPGLILNHYPDLSKPRSQYLPLLELSARENPEDDQTAFWLGREYLFYGNPDACIGMLKGYLKMPSAVWDEERSAAMRFIANGYQRKGDLHSARLWLLKAIAECPLVREPYLQMVKLGYLGKDWPLVFFMTEEALKITKKSGSYLLEPEAWGYAFYDYGAMACYWLGLYDRALAYAREACRMMPGEERLRKNIELIEKKLKEG
jgi:glycosyltransferase involved in cell wall biosynthesis